MAEEKEVKMAEAVVTDELREKMCGLIGTSLRIDKYIFNEEVNRCNIRRFAEGIGDTNPLWYDEEYAKKTRYGRLPAPPLWVLSVLPAIIQFGWRGLGGFHSGSVFEFYKPALIGDKITPESVFAGWEEKTSRFAGHMIMHYCDDYWRNQDGDLIAKFRGYIIMIERAKAKKEAKADKRRQVQIPHPYTEEELEKIEEDTLAEEVRGANPRTGKMCK